MRELTIEITNYCTHKCSYCSSDAVCDLDEATMIDEDLVFTFLTRGYTQKEIHSIIKKEIKLYDVINISGGEPLSHPQFYLIYKWCKAFAKTVIVYSNLLTNIRYNANIIDGISVEANLTVPYNTEKIHILKRIKQGREKNKPDVHFSRNFDEDCSCDHRILRPDGSVTKHPCDKWSEVKE